MLEIREGYDHIVGDTSTQRGTESAAFVTLLPPRCHELLRVSPKVDVLNTVVTIQQVSKEALIKKFKGTLVPETHWRAYVDLQTSGR